MYFQEKSLNPKQFFAKSDQDFCKLRPKVRKYAKIMNGFVEIYIVAKCFFGGAWRHFSTDGKLSKSLAELLCRLI